MLRIFTLVLIWSFVFMPKSEAQELADQVRESFQGVESIHVKGAFCKVDIQPATGRTVELDGELRSVRRVDGLKIHYALKNGLLDVWIEQPARITGQLKGYLSFEVPPGISIKVENVSGEVKVLGVGGENTILETVSGGIVAENIPANLQAKSVSGSIKTNTVSGTLHARSVSGALNLVSVGGIADVSSVSGSIVVKSVMGDIKSGNTSGSTNISEVMGIADIKSVSGSVSVTGVKGDVAASTASGSIEVREIVGSLNLTSTSGGIKGSAVILTGNSNFKSSSGSVDISFGNDLSGMTFDLRASSGSVSVGDTRGANQLNVGNGPIVVRGTTTSGSQRYR